MASVQEMKDELSSLIDKAADLNNRLDGKLEEVSELDGYHTGLHAATELGRLDLATFLMTGIAFLAIFGGLFAFSFVRGQAHGIAKKTAEDIAESRLRELTTQLRSEIDGIKQLRERTDQPTSMPSTSDATEAAPESEIPTKG